MYFNLRKEVVEVSKLEEYIIDNYKSDFVGDNDHWTIINTINHVCCWKKIAVSRVENNIKGVPDNILEGKNIDVINNELYVKTLKYTEIETRSFIKQCENEIQNLYVKLNNNDKSSEYVPQDREGTLFDYLKGDLLYHPMSHYLYYAIRNNEYSLFLELKKYIVKTSDTVYKDLSVIDLKEIIDPSKYIEIFGKNAEWKKDDLFIKIKKLTA